MDPVKHRQLFRQVGDFEEDHSETDEALLEKANMSASDIVGIGVGVPGMIDSARGEVVYSNNFGWEHFMLADKVKELMDLCIRVLH